MPKRRRGRSQRMTENESVKTKITDLNQECIIEICRHLNFRDLFNLKQANSIFRDAADYVVSVSDFDFLLTDQPNRMKEVDGQFTVNFLKSFGQKMRSLNITLMKKTGVASMNAQVQSAIEQYCTNGRIKRCKFIEFKLEKKFYMSNYNFFASLESLELIRSTRWLNTDWFINLIATSQNIKNFRLDCIDRCEFKKRYNVFGKIAHSKLERCHLELHSGYTSDLTRPTDNLPMNYTLKELSIGYGSTYDPAVLQFFPNIERLVDYRYTGKYSLNPISTLPALTSFRLSSIEFDDGAVVSFLTKLAERNSLKELKLNGPYGGLSNQHECQLTNIICQMTNLKKLDLWWVIKSQNNKLAIQNHLTNLQEFKVF